MTVISPSPASHIQPRHVSTPALPDALSRLKNDAAARTDNAQPTARERLNRVKEQLDFLKRWGFPPEVTLKQAALLAHELSSAARAFAETAGLRTETPAPGGSAMMGYGELQEDESRPTALSPEDRAVAEEFVNVARQIKQLMEQARRKLQEKAHDAQASGETGLDTTVAALQRLIGLPQAPSFTGLSAVMPSL